MSTPASRAPAARPAQPSKTRATIVWIALAALFGAAVWFSDARWERFVGIFTDGYRYLDLMTRGILQNPFAEPVAGYWTLAFTSMLESVYMAWVGTLIGAVLSVPFGFLAARNVSPAWLVQTTRAVLNAIRAVPELVFAIVIMLPILGFGPLAGTVALGVGAIGTLGKLTAEAIEGIDPGPVEAGEASGAPRWAILRWAYWSQVVPEVLAFWLYRFEINIRASAVLGIIGAGGVGTLLSQLFSKREWEQIGITLLVIILVTLVVDFISGSIRHRIISGETAVKDAGRREEAKAEVAL